MFCWRDYLCAHDNDRDLSFKNIEEHFWGHTVSFCFFKTCINLIWNPHNLKLPRQNLPFYLCISLLIILYQWLPVCQTLTAAEIMMVNKKDMVPASTELTRLGETVIIQINAIKCEITCSDTCYEGEKQGIRIRGDFIYKVLEFQEASQSNIWARTWRWINQEGSEHENHR